MKALYDRAALQFNLAPDHVDTGFYRRHGGDIVRVSACDVAADHDVEYLRQDKPLVKNGIALTRPSSLKTRQW